MAKQCPKCKTNHPDALEFCPADGSSLVPLPPGPSAPRPPAPPPQGRAPRESRFPHTIQRMSPGEAGAPVDAPVAASSAPQDQDATRLYVAQDDHGGVSLRQLLAKGPMASEQAVERLSAIAEKVATERRGTPPAPLTPESIRYGKPDGRGSPTLVAGRPDPAYEALYRAPEWDEGAPGPTADVYALGCILFEAVTGRAPFQGKTPAEVARKAASAAAPAIRQVRREAEIPPALEVEVQRALKKRPGDRHPTAEAFAKAIRTAVREDDRATMALGGGEAAFLQMILAGKSPDEAAKAVGGVSPQVLAAAKAQVEKIAPAAPVARRNDTDRSPALVQAPVRAPDPPPAPPARPAQKAPVGLIVGGVVGAVVLGGVAVFALRPDPPPPTPAPVQVAAPVPPKPEPDVVEAPDVPPAPDVVEAPDVPEEPDVAPEPDVGAKPVPSKPKTKPKVEPGKPEPKPDDKPKPKPEPKRDGPITF